MDLSKLSDADLMALKSGDLSKVSDEGLSSLKGKPKTIAGTVRDAAAGAVRGAGSIGATILAPIDIASDALAGKGLSLESNRQRRTSMDDALRELVGADTDSLAYGGGKLVTEVAGTMGVGGAAANTLSRIPGMASAAPNVLNAIRTAGMSGGNAITRAVGGAVSGGASAGLVDPEHVGTGALLGGALPGAAQVAGKVGHYVGDKIGKTSKSIAERLMQSAIKPTIKQLQNGESETAVKTLLELGISPNKAGVNKLRELIDAKNSQISAAIGSSTATVDRSNVLGALGGVRSKFGNQVSPTSDLGAIQGVADDFTATTSQAIPVQKAQDLKTGTYSVLRDKYGKLGSAETEAQKALARGLKEEIAANVPGVGLLNAEESALLKTLSVAERRALADANKNPMGLAALAGSPASWAAFMADRSATFKALAARMVAAAGRAPNKLQVGSPVEQLSYRAAPVLAADQ
jgi:hypothetical protein